MLLPIRVTAGCNTKLWVEGQTSPGGSRCPRGTGAIGATVSPAARRDECPVSSKHLKMHQGPQKEVAAPAAAPGPSRPQPAPDLPKPKMPKQVRPVRDVLHKQEGSEILCIGGDGGEERRRGICRQTRSACSLRVSAGSAGSSGWPGSRRRARCAFCRAPASPMAVIFHPSSHK